MAAMMGENEGARKTCPSRAISASPDPMPISAVVIGSPIASSEPNAISSTIAAAATPTPLDGPPYGVSAWSTTSPPRLNVTPFPLAALASRISVLASPFELLDPGTLNWMAAYAMCPSAARWPGVPYGSLTLVTPGACRNGSSALLTRASTAGDVIGAPERMASVSVSPDCAAKCSLSSVCPGSLAVKLFSAAAPTRVHSVIRHATPAIHASTVSQRCR
jgi:hypothetical protein